MPSPSLTSVVITIKCVYVCYVDDSIIKLCVWLYWKICCSKPCLLLEVCSGRLPRLVAAAVVRVEGHSRLISSRVDGCSPWVSGLSVYRFLELHRGIQLKCKIMPFHPLLLFIILKGQESSCSGFIPVELYYFRALLSALLFGEARCFLKNTKL